MMKHYTGIGVCPECGKSFERDTLRRRFCSDKCRERFYVKEGNAKAKIKREEAKKLGKKPEPKPEVIYELKCRMCGKTFNSPTRTRVYCSETCRRAANRLAKIQYLERQDLIRMRNAAKQGVILKPRKNSRPGMKQVEYTEGKLWDDNDPECKEVMEYLKTVEPIDWAEINRINEEERIRKLRAEANEPKTHRGKYVRRNNAIKYFRKG